MPGMAADSLHELVKGLGLALPAESRERLARYVSLVFKWQRLVNLTGARDPDSFIQEHVADCLSVLPWIDGMGLADIGSGGGLPGLIIACARPDLEISLVEPRGKRARFLQQAVIELQLPRVEVIPLRVEAWRATNPPRTLISRALSSLQAFVAATRHLHLPDTRLLAMKAEEPVNELAAEWARGFVHQTHPLRVPGRKRCLVVLRPRPA